MSSIDERIVSIKFNNAQFEAGIRTTVSSLDGLKKTLNFSAGISALGDLDAAGKKVNLKVDNAGFDASVKHVVDSANDIKKNLKFDGVTKGLSDLDAAGKNVKLTIDPTPFQMGAKGIVDAANTIKQNMNFESVQRGIGNLKSSVQNFSWQSVITGAQNAGRAIGDLDLAGKAVSFLPISDGAEKASQKISAMSIAGIAALGGIAFKAVSVGGEMAKSLFIDPAKSGLAEYELNLGSIQTILANTQSKGSNLGDVNAALDELNAYSDKTIYNFAEMAKNIGTFTSAGVNLKDSTASIKGIANLAALSGSNSEQASTAMYQLSQAMSTGKVSLMDWNSVVNAGMGGEVFQNAIKETARNQGIAVDGIIEKNGSFRDSLQEGWLTSSVLTETLSKMTGDLNDEQLRSMGYNDEQIAGIQKMATTASDAATKIKTFTQLTGTLTEITGSGWATSWKLILGDFEQAKEMWTNVYKVIGSMVQGTADARNKMLGDWNAAGGRTEMIWAVTGAFKVLMGVLNPIKDAFREVFPATTGKQLYEITQAIRIFIDTLLPGEQATSLIKNTFKLLFTIIKIGVDIIKGAIGVVVAFFKAFATGGDSIAGSMKPLTDFLGTLADRIKNSTVIVDFFNNLAKGAAFLGEVIRRVIGIVLNIVVPFVQLQMHIIGLITWSTLFAHYFGKVGDALEIVGASIKWVLGYLENLSISFREVVNAFINGGLDAAIQAFKDSLNVMGDVGDAALTRISERIESIKRFADRLANAWDQTMAAISRVWEKIKPIREAIANMFKDIGQEIKASLTDVNFDDTLDLVNTGLLVGLVLLFKGFFKKMTGMGDGMKDSLLKNLTSSFDSINGVLDQLTGTLGAMQQNLKADTLMKLAIAIGIMAISVVALSFIDSGKLTKALIGIAVMVVILGKAMEMLDKISTGNGFLKIPFIAASMILLAIALTILTIPVLILSRLSWGELIKGLLGVSIMLKVLTKATESMAKNPANLIATGVGLIAVAIAVKLLADAVVTMAQLSFEQLIKGLGGMSIVLFALSKTVDSMAKNPADLIATGIGLMAVAVAVKILASAVSDFGTMDIPTIIQGIIAMGIVLKLLETFSKGVGDVKNMIQTGISMVILALAMKLMASAIGDFAAFSWEEIAKGLLVLAVSLKVIVNSFQGVNEKDILQKAFAFGIVAIALKVLASALKDMGGMSWEEIGKGMVVLAGSMLILAIGLDAMSGSLAGAAALFVVAAGLAILAPVLVQLGNLSWEQIGMGMAALAAVFLIFGLAGLILAPIVPVIFALGVSIGMLGLGLMAIGLGVLAFSTGLALISTVVLATGPALILFVGSILALIPLAMMELGKGIVAFAQVIGDSMPIFLDAFVKLLITLLTAIDIVFPKLMETLWIVIVGLVDLLVRAIPLFVDAGMKLIIGILDGVGKNMGQLVDSATTVVTEFIDGIARNLPKIIQSGFNLVISFVEGLAKSVRENSDRMSTAGLDLAQAIIDGMVNGIGKGIDRVVNAAKDLAGNALDSVKNFLGIHSPSREFVKIGMFINQGLAIGITDYAGLVTKAANSMGNSALDTLKNTMAKVGSAVSGDINMQPVIRPVLDLSAVKKDSGLIAGMITPPNLALDGLYHKAATLAVADRANKAPVTDVSQAVATTSDNGDNITFIQNNNSPKTLSRAEIYRQTNNLISVAKK
jgi:tape measure domain-containing protein